MWLSEQCLVWCCRSGEWVWKCPCFRRIVFACNLCYCSTSFWNVLRVPLSGLTAFGTTFGRRHLYFATLAHQFGWPRLGASVTSKLNQSHKERLFSCRMMNWKWGLWMILGWSSVWQFARKCQLKWFDCDSIAICGYFYFEFWPRRLLVWSTLLGVTDRWASQRGFGAMGSVSRQSNPCGLVSISAWSRGVMRCWSLFLVKAGNTHRNGHVFLTDFKQFRPFSVICHQQSPATSRRLPEFDLIYSSKKSHVLGVKFSAWHWQTPGITQTFLENMVCLSVEDFLGGALDPCEITFAGLWIHWNSSLLSACVFGVMDSQFKKQRGP